MSNSQTNSKQQKELEAKKAMVKHRLRQDLLNDFKQSILGESDLQESHRT